VTGLSGIKIVDVLLIAVNYKSAQPTALLLQDALRQNTQHCQVSVAIADNGPSACDLAALRDQYSGNSSVRFESMSHNVGYFGAAHRVLQSLCAERLPDWIVVSNTDIRLPQSDLFDRLAQMQFAPAVIAPRIISGRTGLDQNPFHLTRPSAFRMLVNRILPRVPVLFWLLQVQCAVKRRIRRFIAPQTSPAQSRPAKIYAPHGAFIIFNRKYFEEGGNLNVGAFLFAEEKFVAETCRRLKLDVLYVPAIEVIHDEHVSTGQNPAVPRFQAEAADYLYHEFFCKQRTAL
jgi:GT2 family glycosyltransferase